MIKNIPYKKQYDSEGKEIIPSGVYAQSNPTRRQRREAMKKFLKLKRNGERN